MIKNEPGRIIALEDRAVALFLDALRTAGASATPLRASVASFRDAVPDASDDFYSGIASQPARVKTLDCMIPPAVNQYGLDPNKCIAIIDYNGMDQKQ